MLSLALLPWHPDPQLGPSPCWARVHLSAEPAQRRAGRNMALHPLQYGVSQGPALRCSSQAHFFPCLALLHRAWSTGNRTGSASAQEKGILCQQSPQPISENISGHILVLGKHLYHATKAVYTKTRGFINKGAREGPQKLSVPHAEVLSDWPRLKWPFGFSLAECGPKLGWGLCCVDHNEVQNNAAGSLLQQSPQQAECLWWTLSHSLKGLEAY